MVSSSSFKIGTNLKINLDGEKDKPDVKPKNEHDIKSNKEHKQDVKIDLDGQKDKPNIKSNKEHKQDVKMMKTESDMNKITYEEERVALVLGIKSTLQYGGCSNELPSPCLYHEICVDQNSNTCDKCPQILR